MFFQWPQKKRSLFHFKRRAASALIGSVLVIRQLLSNSSNSIWNKREIEPFAATEVEYSSRYEERRGVDVL
ncbi:hypothetical protein BC351_40310 [Paenibacillus ferrarius]|uniref:Uncharacterized protein n=1 Tax=Paenibacillus ferrarius TaxID=1469647 RepID=A0A1V4H8J6_9BACL|nr:hypothetical protein BC351_40310 [Paenibacillus ferrarius]